MKPGFAIGGVAPIGHLNPIMILLDETLLGFDDVWAAAGRPDSVFKVNTQKLADAINCPNYQCGRLGIRSMFAAER